MKYKYTVMSDLQETTNTLVHTSHFSMGISRSFASRTPIERHRIRQRRRVLDVQRKQRHAILIRTIQELKVPRMVAPLGTTLHPCLFSYAKSIPLSILLHFSKCPPTFTNRNMYLKHQTEVCMNKCAILRHSYYDHEFKTLCTWFIKERQCLYAFKRLVMIWIYKKYKNRRLNTEDPITMSIPKNPIYSFDVSRRGMYIFEAYCLKKHMETGLFYSEWLFPEPNHPKNPLTNLEFTEAQRIAILMSLRTKNYGSWIFEAYRAFNWNLDLVKEEYQVPLKLQALRDLVRNPSSDETIEFVQEYIIDEYNYHKLPRTTSHISIHMMKWAVKHMYTTTYIKKWIDLFEDHYRSSILFGEYDPTHQRKIELYNFHVRSKKLFNDSTSYKELEQVYLRENPVIRSRTHLIPRIDPSIQFVLPSVSHRLLQTTLLVQNHDEELDESDTESEQLELLDRPNQDAPLFVQDENRVIVSLSNGDIRIIYTQPNDMYRLTIGNPSSTIEDGANSQM